MSPGPVLCRVASSRLTPALLLYFAAPVPRHPPQGTQSRGGRGGRDGEEEITVSGLLVQDVDPDGRAADAGIQPGDVIQEVNRQPVRTVEALKNAVGTKSNKPLLFLISRGGQDRFLTVRPNS